MVEFMLFVLTFLYLVVSAKVDEWITISALGFKSATPLLFLQKPKVYDFVRSVLFLLAVATCFFMTSIPWYVGLIILGVVWLWAGSIGRRKAFKSYRLILLQMVETAETPEQKAEYEEMLKKSDQELLDMAQTMMKIERPGR